MVKEFTLSDEWRILRNAVSVYYKNIERDICSVIYVDVEKKYAGIYNEEQIKLIQHNEICNSLSIIYNSIYKKFFNINNLDEFLKNPKW
ncbi:hypothetical protein EOM09_05565, partial [bacterium]|nr:hypothetical protein [bacterium]